MKNLHVTQSVGFGWATFKKLPWLFISVPLVLLAIDVAITLVESVLTAVFGVEQMKLVIDIESLATCMLVAIGTVSFYLKAHSSVERTELRDLWNPAPFWRFLGVSCVGGVLIMLGLVLLVVPGILVAVAFSFAGILVVDKGMGPIEALKESVRMTKGHRFELFMLSLTNIGLNVLGLLAFVVGLFVSMPVTELAFIHAYRRLSKKEVGD